MLSPPVPGLFVKKQPWRMRKCHKNGGLRGPNTFPFAEEKPENRGINRPDLATKALIELWALNTNSSVHCGIWSHYFTLDPKKNWNLSLVTGKFSYRYVSAILRLACDEKWLLVVYPPFPGKKKTDGNQGCQLKIGTVPSRRNTLVFGGVNG